MPKTCKKPTCIAHLARLGITVEDAAALRRAAMTLHRWYERVCNGEVERDDETGKTFGVRPGAVIRRWPTLDMETGAQKRIAAIMKRYPDLLAYHQTDPRGAPLYIIPLERLDGRDPEQYYSMHGTAVHK